MALKIIDDVRKQKQHEFIWKQFRSEAQIVSQAKNDSMQEINLRAQEIYPNNSNPYTIETVNGIPVLIGRRFKISENYIACGTFESVYPAIDITNHSNNEENSLKKYVIKAEDLGCNCPQLKHEYKIYQKLRRGMGFPHCYMLQKTKKHYLMFMDMLGNLLPLKSSTTCYSKF